MIGFFCALPLSTLAVRLPAAHLAFAPAIRFSIGVPCGVLVSVPAVGTARLCLGGSLLANEWHSSAANILGVRDWLKVIRIEAPSVLAFALALVAGLRLVANVIKLVAFGNLPLDALKRVDMDGDQSTILISGSRIAAIVNASDVKPAATFGDAPVFDKSLPDGGKWNATRILSLSHSILLRSFRLGSRAVSSSVAARFHFSAEVSA